MERTQKMKGVHGSRIVLVAACIASLSGMWAGGDIPPDEAPARQPIRLLTIGNSFSRNATTFLAQLMEAAGYHLVHGQASLGGCSLQRHWRLVEAYETGGNPEAGRLYAHGGQHLSLREFLELEPWDFVTIQQVSAASIDGNTFEPYASNLHDYIRRHAPGAEILVHQTWAYHPDSARLKLWEISVDEMHARLTRNYRQLARTLGCRLIPTGSAFQRTLNHPDWVFLRRDPEFDFEQAAPPHLPVQAGSMHMGWRWNMRAEPPTLGVDSHASHAGRYLGSAVFFEVLTGESVVGNPFVHRVTPETARFLQQMAHETVREGAPDGH